MDGAVADALAFKTYLEEDLGVQPSRIRLLLNAQATRCAIIQELSNLADDQSINHGDPIFIFYAGHGGEVDTPKGWKAGDPKVQMLIPHDYRPDVDGRGVHGIPDRTIGALLSRIAAKQGDNIVRISTLCHNLYPANRTMCRQSSSIAVTLGLAHAMLHRNSVVKHGLLR